MVFEHHLKAGLDRTTHTRTLTDLKLKVREVGLNTEQHPFGSISFVLKHAGKKRLTNEQLNWLHDVLSESMRKFVTEDLKIKYGPKPTLTLQTAMEEPKFPWSFLPKIFRKPVVKGTFSWVHPR